MIIITLVNSLKSS